MPDVEWLPEPEPGTKICLGFDGSDVSDWTVLRAQTIDGFCFTPRWGLDRRPAIWIPAEWGGRVPRSSVDEAVREVHERFDVKQGFYDPPRYATEIETWQADLGDKVVQPWETYRPKFMHEALERFYVDLEEGRITHDGCPLTMLAMANARKRTKGSTYILAKPSEGQKIDPAMATVLAHEAAADATAAGWGDEVDTRVFCFR